MGKTYPLFKVRASDSTFTALRNPFVALWPQSAMLNL